MSAKLPLRLSPLSGLLLASIEVAPSRCSRGSLAGIAWSLWAPSPLPQPSFQNLPRSPSLREEDPMSRTIAFLTYGGVAAL